MNSAAGVGGPPVSLYAVNAFSVASNGLPRLSTPNWVAVAVAMLVGGVIGRGLASRTPERRARLLVLLPALTGGVTAVVKGLWGM